MASSEQDGDMVVMLAEPLATLLPTSLVSPPGQPAADQALRVLLYCSARASQLAGSPMRVHAEGRLWGHLNVVDEETQAHAVWPPGPVRAGQPCLCWWVVV